ncbi:MAG: adenylyl-sulfate kinase [Bacteroidota bacterium]|nr:adenylyl-sulfate kinase [Bacteroidota bacterium]
MSNNIFPIYDQLVSRQEKEDFLNQQGAVFWLTGLSGSGKSTMAKQLERQLFNEGFVVQVLDGDNVRSGINNNLGFSEDDRKENIRRIAEIAKLFSRSGIVTICSFVSPKNDLREMAQRIIGDEFHLVYISSSLKKCEERDVKGLYAKARKGEIKNFTGIDAPFDIPSNPHLTLDTEKDTIEDSTASLYHYAIKHIKKS